VPRPLIRPEALLTIELLAFWPVWRWYVHRMIDQSDEAWGIAALVTALFFVFSRSSSSRNERRAERMKIKHEETKDAKKNRKTLRVLRFFAVDFLKRPESVPDSAKSNSAPPRLMLPAAILLYYSLSYHFLSPLPRAAIAVTAIAATVSAIRLGRRMHLGVWGLLLLALPVVASLQFYIGFPMRAVVARLAAPMLQINGFAVTAVGASLNWNGDPILIDAPCSGVKMLWTGFYLTFALACYYKLNAKRTAFSCLATFGAVITGNAFRAAALFYVEAGAANLPLPGWTHEGVGVVVFAATAVAIALMSQRIAKTELLWKRYFSLPHFPVGKTQNRKMLDRKIKTIAYALFCSLHRLLPAGRRRAFRANTIGCDE
jgi:exosortase/archaeosortase family protein